jgi:toxin ParE1/3/4
MGRLRYSRAARADLEKIAVDIVENSGAAVAERVIARLEKSLRTVADFPGLGRKRPGLGRNVWSWPMRPWVAFYRITGEDVEVIRVLHGKRRITRELVEGERD